MFAGSAMPLVALLPLHLCTQSPRRKVPPCGASCRVREDRRDREDRRNEPRETMVQPAVYSAMPARGSQLLQRAAPGCGNDPGPGVADEILHRMYQIHARTPA